MRNPRKPRLPVQSEDDLCKAIHELLSRTLDERVVYFHVPNGGSRHGAEAKKLKEMGVLPGVADYLFFWTSRRLFGGALFNSQQSLAIEIKVSNRPQSGDQVQFQEDWQATGGVYIVCRSVAEVVRALKYHGVPFKNEVKVQ